jgi:hypothetical protein
VGWIYARICFNCRDGLNVCEFSIQPFEHLLILFEGADFWRSIPLGFRVRAAWLAEIPQLPRR